MFSIPCNCQAISFSLLLILPRLIGFILTQFFHYMSKSTWPNADSSVVIMGDDSSKNNNQIYCLIKFSLFLLCHVKVNKKVKKDKNKKRKHTIRFRNWIIINIIPWHCRFFISTKSSCERHFEKRRFTKKCLLTKVSAFKKKFTPSKWSYLLLESAHIQWNYLAVESVLLFLFKSLANRSSHSEVFREMVFLNLKLKSMKNTYEEVHF